MPSRRPALVSLIALATLLLASVTVARAQAPLAEKMPADVILYAGWAGSENLQGQYDGTHAQALYDASNFDDVFHRFVPALLDKLGREEPETRDAIAAIKTVGPILFRRPTALVFGGVDYADGEAKPKIVLACDAGPDAAVLRARLTEVVTRLGRPELATLVREDDGLVVAVYGYSDLALADAAADAAKSLAGDGGFAQTFAELAETPALAVYADVPKAVDFAREITRRENGEAALADFDRIVEVLGVGGLGRLGYTGAFDGKMYETRAFLATTAREGVLRLLPDGPLDEKTLAAIPADATMAFAGQFDPRELLEVIRDIAVASDPQAAGQIEQGLGIANAFAGTDVENEFLARFGTTWAGYVSPQVGSGIFSGVLVNRPDDAKRLAESFGRVSVNATLLANQQLRENSGPGGPAITLPGRIVETEAAGKLYVLNLPLVGLSWGVDEPAGVLRFGFFPQSIVSAKIADDEGDAGSLVNSAKWKTLREGLDVEAEPAAMQFADLPKLAEDSYPLILLGSQTLFGFADLFAEELGIRPPAMVLPPLAVLRRHLEPSGAMTWVADDGIRFRGHEPFPLSNVLTTDAQQIILNYASVLPSVLLPSLNRAREAANKVKSASNLRQIGMTMRQFAIDDRRGGRFPADLRAMFLGANMEVELFVNPRTSTRLPAAMIQSREGQADWVAANSDYIYVGGGLTDTATSTVPVAYEDPAKVGNADEGLIVLYADGSVRFVTLPEFERDLRKHVEYRGSRKLPVPDAVLNLLP